MSRDWKIWAMGKLESEKNRSVDTHLVKFDHPSLLKHDIHLYLKDESTHPTGSLKHRLARSLYLYGISNNWINSETTIVEASSGSTAISEAYFARILGLDFIAVIPKHTSKRKVDSIKFYGGKCHLVDAKDMYTEAQRLAQQLNGFYMDQFTYAERATDWRGNNNIAESIFNQLSLEKYSDPEYIVMSAGTGGTSGTIGRYINYNPTVAKNTKLVVCDPENSVFYDYFQTRDRSITSDVGSRIEGIGRPRVEPSFIADVVDEMIRVKDEDSVGTIYFVNKYLGKKVGASTGTNVYTAFTCAQKMIREGISGSIVTILCDSGDRYYDTYYNNEWLKQNGFDIEKVVNRLENFDKNTLM